MNILTLISSMFYMLAMVLLYITFTDVAAIGAPAAVILTCLAAVGGSYSAVCAMEYNV